jgi:platelet-activating factor acetylhydrolase
MAASLAFLDSNFEQYIEEALSREMEALVIGIKPNGRPKRKLRGDVGDIIVH